MKFRPQFRLRTLFVLVALVAAFMGWIGYQVHLVRERRAMLKNVLYAGPGNITIANPRRYSDLPFYRKWLGDTEYTRIDAQNRADAKKIAALSYVMAL